jgi:gamma-glutamyltranspeptidase / glutathione hydrolase
MQITQHRYFLILQRYVAYHFRLSRKYCGGKQYFIMVPSRKSRSVLYSTKGIVTCTQPLAVQAGLLILSKNGNCFDAAVAVGACLSVLEPSSTGPGGDFFALIFKNGAVTGINGSGKCAKELTLETVLNERSAGIISNEGGFIDTRYNTGSLKILDDSVHSITVPGTIAAWVDLVELHGSHILSLSQILQPAIDLARNGFPLSEIAAKMWIDNEEKLIRQNSNGCRFVPAPHEGGIRKLPGLAILFEIVGSDGKDAFYSGSITNSILETTS